MQLGRAVLATTVISCTMLGNAGAAIIQSPMLPPPPLAPCIPVSQPPIASPESIIVILPKTLGPRGCPVRTRHGTRIYKQFVQSVSWTTFGPHGPIHNDSELSGLVVAAQRSGSRLVIRTHDGQSLAFPPNAVINPPSPMEFSMSFVQPGAPVPPGLVGVRPDYVVP